MHFETLHSQLLTKLVENKFHEMGYELFWYTTELVRNWGTRHLHAVVNEYQKIVSCETFNVSRQEVDPEIVRYYTKLRSVLRRMIELERCLGVARDEKSLRREHIRLGLEVSVAGECGVWAPGIPPRWPSLL
ncbi:hypothetical protein BJY52DRAFT_1228531 [Lactarius psammicola]|nr:hypothetical protein BJY52DRAFT_1228531 [Lactarius psammicola]